MSKYTTEVRFICESKADLEESKGFSQIETILDNSWDKIFTTQCEFFDATYKPVLCKKILKHYYTREIGFETAGLWMLWMNRRLEEIMPYYNQLYSSALLEFNPLYDVDYTREGNRQNDGTSETSGTNSQTNNKTTRDLFSDTPQGALNGVESETYLTDARKVTDAGTNTGTYSDANETNTTEEYTERVHGKIGGANYSKMLIDFRSTMLNIDMQVIEEFSDLFMGLW